MHRRKLITRARNWRTSTAEYQQQHLNVSVQHFHHNKLHRVRNDSFSSALRNRGHCKNRDYKQLQPYNLVHSAHIQHGRNDSISVLACCPYRLHTNFGMYHLWKSHNCKKLILIEKQSNNNKTNVLHSSNLRWIFWSNPAFGWLRLYYFRLIALWKRDFIHKVFTCDVQNFTSHILTISIAYCTITFGVLCAGMSRI